MALADHGGLHGLFNARGTIGPFHIHDHASHVQLKAREPIDVAIVGAQLDPGGQTGWHTHPGRVDRLGPARRPRAEDGRASARGRCVERTFQPGQAFVHPAGPHNFVNTDTQSPLAFGVAYFVPVGATLLTPAPRSDRPARWDERPRPARPGDRRARGRPRRLRCGRSAAPVRERRSVPRPGDDRGRASRSSARVSSVVPRRCRPGEHLRRGPRASARAGRRWRRGPARRAGRSRRGATGS